MISALRRRFIWGGMIALLILLILLIGALCISTYINNEHNDEAFFQSILNKDTTSDVTDVRNDGKMRFGPSNNQIPVRTHRSYYIVTIDLDGEITDITARGIWDEDKSEPETLAQTAIATGKTRGRVNSQYRYAMQSTETGATLILLDDFLQSRMLLNMLGTSALFSLVIMITMFLILLPVSAQVVRSYAANAERQKQFITNAGHELKTPLAIIQSNLDAMELIVGENKWSRNIRSQSSRLTALIQRLLFMARMDEHSVREKREKLDLVEMIRTESAVYASMIEEKQLKYSTLLPESLEMIGHREYLNQMLHVMLENAVQYVSDNGWIKVVLSRQRHRAVMTFENSVSALPDCPSESLFERFYRGDSSHSQSGGHGIGLSAAKAIAEMHSGTIRAEYREQSICFIIELKQMKG